jgi:hypothetical protein
VNPAERDTATLRQQWAAARQMSVRKGRRGPLDAAVTELPHSLADHVTRWQTSRGKWACVLQPYHLHLDDMRDLIDLCERHGLEAEVDPLAQWHHREVVGIVLREADD